MRSDYCPISKEPCQSLCDTPCSRELVGALRAAIDALDRNTSPFPLSMEETFAVLDAGRAALAKAGAQ